MKLILTQPEIEAAVRKYISDMITINDGATMEIEFTAGRGENGLSASVDINYLSVKSIDLTPDAAPPSKPVNRERTTTPSLREAKAAEEKAADSAEEAAAEAQPAPAKGESLF